MITTKQFVKLPRKERAILIAQDVIDMIKTKSYKPGHNYSTRFVDNKDIPNEYDDELNTSLIYRDFMNQDASVYMKNNPNKIKCIGCARASLFLSSVKFKNAIKIEDIVDINFGYTDNEPGDETEADDGTKYLSPEFSEEQQAIIETAFEGQRFGKELSEKWSPEKKINFSLSLELALKFRAKVREEWRKWYDKRTTPRPSFNSLVLTRICENIVKNDGTFNP